ncbi:TPA: hypothetical protein ACHD50_001465, partial [Campylobacter lari]|nr:hypothetical protein [Campylobacter lari]
MVVLYIENDIICAKIDDLKEGNRYSFHLYKNNKCIQKGTYSNAKENKFEYSATSGEYFCKVYKVCKKEITYEISNSLKVSFDGVVFYIESNKMCAEYLGKIKNDKKYLYEFCLYKDGIEVEKKTTEAIKCNFDYHLINGIYYTSVAIIGEDGFRNYWQSKNINLNLAEKFFIAARSDGFGARILPLLNAMVLSMKTGVDFKFVWEERKENIINGAQKVDGNQIAGIQIMKEQDIFSDNFLNLHSLTDKIPSNNNSTYYRIFKGRSIGELLQFEDCWYGKYVTYEYLSDLLRDFDENEYKILLKKAWRKLDFCENIKNIFKIVDGVVQNIRSFTAIHIRSGDGVFQLYNSNLSYSKKIMPLEVAYEFILTELRNNNNIILFGDDIDGIKNLKNKILDFYPNGDTKLLLSFEIAQKYNIDYARLVFFDIYLMSKATKIIGPEASSFSELSKRISNAEYVNIYSTCSNKEICNLIIKNINKINSHRFQKAFSYFTAYKMAISTKSDLSIQYDLINKSVSYADEFVWYKLCLINVLYALDSKRDIFKIYDSMSQLQMEVYIKLLETRHTGKEVKNSHLMLIQEYTNTKQ